MNKFRRIWALAVCAAATFAAGNSFAQNNDFEKKLQELFATAEARNVSIRSFRSATLEAEAACHEAKSARLPDISAEASVSFMGNGRVLNRSFGDGQLAKIPHFGNNFALRAQQVIYAGGAINGGISLAEQAKRLAELSEQENVQNVRFMLAGLYLQLHNVNNSKRIYDANAELAASIIRHMQHKRDEGMLLKNDVTRHELVREQILLGSARMTDQARIIRHELATTLDGDTSTLALLGEETFATLSPPLGTEEEWQQLAIMNSIGMKQSEVGIDMRLTEERIARAARRPKLALFAENHLNGPITIEIPAIDRNFNYWYAGVGISYNFSALYKAKRSIKKAQVATQHAKDRHETVRERVSNAVHSAYVDCQTATTELRTQQKRVELATENYAVISNRYANGLALITDLTDATNAKLDAELALANARINLAFCFCKLKHAASAL